MISSISLTVAVLTTLSSALPQSSISPPSSSAAANPPQATKSPAYTAVLLPDFKDTGISYDLSLGNTLAAFNASQEHFTPADNFHVVSDSRCQVCTSPDAIVDVVPFDADLQNIMKVGSPATPLLTTPPALPPPDEPAFGGIFARQDAQGNVPYIDQACGFFETGTAHLGSDAAELNFLVTRTAVDSSVTEIYIQMQRLRLDQAGSNWPWNFFFDACSATLNTLMSGCQCEGAMSPSTFSTGGTVLIRQDAAVSLPQSVPALRLSIRASKNRNDEFPCEPPLCKGVQ
ncbi:MAG: hypothetical protein M1817_003674 [Caeruleum heppii]|nr:MAG: hypothetical protein M1817_003674 [Caeruleum heppii]